MYTLIAAVHNTKADRRQQTTSGWIDGLRAWETHKRESKSVTSQYRDVDRY